MLPRHLQISAPEVEDELQDLRYEVEVYDRPHPDRSEKPLLCLFSALMTSCGEWFLFLCIRMGRENELPSLTVLTPCTTSVMMVSITPLVLVLL